jgi:hypothetical protein
MKDYLFILSLVISLSQLIEWKYNILGMLDSVFYSFIITTIIYILVYIYNRYIR